MASSTNEPMAMAMPPRLIVLMLTFINRSIITVMMIDIGSATSETIVVRRFIRKKNSTIITIKAPSSNDSWRLLTELAMNSLWRKISVDTVTSGGRVECNAASSESIFSVSPMVPTAGCLVTVRSTAGSVFTDATPNLGSLAPSFTWAISASVIVPDASDLTTVFAISSVSDVLTLPFMIYSLPNS